MGTKKILNKDVANVVEESLAGYLMAYRRYFKKVSVTIQHFDGSSTFFRM